MESTIFEQVETVDELIEQLKEIRGEYGGDVEVEEPRGPSRESYHTGPVNVRFFEDPGGDGGVVKFGFS